jgi:hypothetical protein
MEVTHATQRSSEPLITRNTHHRPLLRSDRGRAKLELMENAHESAATYEQSLL